jgi:hypothetical protein
MVLILFINIYLFLGRQVPEGTTRLTDEKGSPTSPPTQSSVSSPTHVPGSYKMLQKCVK